MRACLQSVHAERTLGGGDIGNLNELPAGTVCDVMVVNDGPHSQPITPGMLVAAAAQYQRGTVNDVHILGATEFHAFPGDNDAAVVVFRKFVTEVLHDAAARHLEHEVAGELAGAPSGTFHKWFLRLAGMWTQQDGEMRLAKPEESDMELHDIVFACRLDPSKKNRKLPGTNIILYDGDVWMRTTARPQSETVVQARERVRLDTAIRKGRKVVRKSAFVR